MNTVDGPYLATLESHPSQSRSFHAGRDFLRGMILGNFFYILSAFLMMLGCFLLMPTSSIEEAEQFARRLQSLLILEGYQLLVIATAIVIVRRLKILSDAATLLLIAVTLLLDPTFFSNAFLTLRTPESLWVNACCLLLVPIKLWVLEWGLRIRLTPRGMGAMIVVGFLVYFGPLVFNFGELPADESILYYLLGWSTFSLSLLFPWYGRVFTEKTYRSQHLSRSQKHWIPRLLVAIPMVVATMHYLESASVYEINFYPVYMTPLLLTVIYLFLRMGRKSSDPLIRCIVIDTVGLFALLVSVPAMTELSVPVKADRNLIPGWLLTHIPLGVSTLAIAGAYVFCARRYDYRPALYRIGILVLAGLGYLAVQNGWAYSTGRWTFIHVMEYPRLVLFLFSPALIALAYRFPNFWLWLVESILAICFFFSFLGGNLYQWFPEILQSIFLATMILYHRFPDPRNEKITLALLLVIFGLGRLLVDPSGWALCIVLVESIGLMVAGHRLSIRGYLWTGCLQAIGLVSYGGYLAQELMNTGYLVLIVGLTLFFIGTGVTFNKKQILRWFD